MELVKRQSKKKRGAAKAKKQRGSAPRTKQRVGRREGAGRPSLYPGKVTDRHIIGYLTPEGWEKLEEIKKVMLERNKREDITAITMSDALEEAVHRLHRELTRPR